MPEEATAVIEPQQQTYEPGQIVIWNGQRRVYLERSRIENMCRVSVPLSEVHEFEPGWPDDFEIRDLVNIRPLNPDDPRFLPGDMLRLKPEHEGDDAARWPYFYRETQEGGDLITFSPNDKDEDDNGLVLVFGPDDYRHWLPSDGDPVLINKPSAPPEPQLPTDEEQAKTAIINCRAFATNTLNLILSHPDNPLVAQFADSDAWSNRNWRVPNPPPTDLLGWGSLAVKWMAQEPVVQAAPVGRAVTVNPPARPTPDRRYAFTVEGTFNETGQITYNATRHNSFSIRVPRAIAEEGADAVNEWVNDHVWDGSVDYGDENTHDAGESDFDNIEYLEIDTDIEEAIDEWRAENGLDD